MPANSQRGGSRRHFKAQSLQDFDLRLLRVFRAVVQCQGLAPAQEALGLSLSTISLQLKQLEQRLGFTLCERGRKGFALTDEGQQIYDSLFALFDSIENFQDAVAELRGRMADNLHFGVVDALSSHPDLALAHGIHSFAQKAPDVSLHVDIATPQELIQSLIDERYDCILTPVRPVADSVEAELVFTERQQLYCSLGHPLFAEQDPQRILDALRTTTFTDKSYASEAVTDTLSQALHGPSISHMESNALLILSGHYVGYLPEHFAARWVANGSMRALLPERASFATDFYLATNRRHRSRSADLFKNEIIKALRCEKTEAETIPRSCHRLSQPAKSSGRAVSKI